MPIELCFEGCRVLRPGGWEPGPLSLSAGVIADAPVGRRVDLSGFDLLPGIVDVHGDGFERHMAPRRGALRTAASGVVACAAELAANGITTAVLAQFYSWEGGMRGPDFAEHVFESVAEVAPTLAVDLRLQLRLETHLLDEFSRAEAAVDRFGIGYVVFNDHLPHDRLAEGRTPPRLTGQALKSGRNPAAHLALMQALHARGDEVPEALRALCGRLGARGVRLGSHDDRDAAARVAWRGWGVQVSEFPETFEAAAEAAQAGEPVVLGAPNVVRGASHAGNVSALELIEAGLVTALASDYHYPAPLQAALKLVELEILDISKAWRLVSEGPAEVLGLADRGRLLPGLRADITLLERATGRVAGTIAGGEIAYLTAPAAARFLG